MDQTSSESTEAAKDAPLVRAPAGLLGANALLAGDVVSGGHARNREAALGGRRIALARPTSTREVSGVPRTCASARINLAPQGDRKGTVVQALHSNALSPGIKSDAEAPKAGKGIGDRTCTIALARARSFSAEQDVGRATAARVPVSLPFRRELLAGKFCALDLQGGMNPVCLNAASEARG